MSPVTQLAASGNGSLTTHGLARLELEEVKRHPEVSRDLVDQFVRDWQHPLTFQQRRHLATCAQEALAHLRARMFDLSDEVLCAIGARYIPIPGKSAVGAHPTLLPPAQQERAMVQAIFYGWLQNHPCTLSAYQRIAEQGPVYARGNRLPEDHPLFDKVFAHTFADFGYEPVAPEADDGIQERTSHALALGGAFSWHNHLFPSSFISAAAMPTVLSDLALAEACLSGMVAFVPLDGDCAEPQHQMLRYRSAKALIERSPIVLSNPYRDDRLPDGSNVFDFSLLRAKRNLGVALKPGRSIVERAKPYVLEEGLVCIEVYDPGNTNLLLPSVEALRKEFGERIAIYAGRVAGHNSQPLIEALTRLRATIRYGIAEGSICSTSEMAGGISPRNLQNAARILNAAEQIHSNTGQRLIVTAEANATERLVLLALLGIAGYSTSATTSGTLAQVPPLYHFNGAKPWDGEASDVTKEKGGQVDALGNPINPEGASGKRPLRTRNASVPGMHFAQCAGIVKGDRFCRKQHVRHQLVDPAHVPESVAQFTAQALGSAKLHYIS